MQQRQYNNYEDYTKHQAEKTMNSKLRDKLAIRFDADITRFRKHFSILHDYAPVGIRILCMGARTGSEVVAARQEGFEATGIDLVPCMPLVAKGDFHNIPHEDESFDCVYCNCVDHVLDFQKFASEIKRVLKHPGWLLVCLTMHTMGNYEATKIETVEEFLEFFPEFEVLYRQSNDKEGSSERITLVMRINL